MLGKFDILCVGELGVLCTNNVAHFTFQRSLNLIIIKEIVTVKISFTVSPSLRLPVLKLLGSWEHFTIFISIRGYLLMNRIIWSVNYTFIIYQHFSPAIIRK